MKDIILFLDIDGVLNNNQYKRDEELCLNINYINNLLCLISKFPTLKIVWSTSWRFFDKDKYLDLWINPVMYLEKNYPQIKSRIIDKTPMKMTSRHFHDIKWWLDKNYESVSKFVILEDSYFPTKWFGLENHLVQTNSEIGFDEICLQKAIDILNNQKFNLAKFLDMNIVDITETIVTVDGSERIFKYTSDDSNGIGLYFESRGVPNEVISIQIGDKFFDKDNLSQADRIMLKYELICKSNSW